MGCWLFGWPCTPFVGRGAAAHSLQLCTRDPRPCKKWNRWLQGGLRAEDEKQLHMLRRRLEAEVLGAADVVCATCVGAGDARLRGFRFQHVLIDEATQVGLCLLLLDIEWEGDERDGFGCVCICCVRHVLIDEATQVGPVLHSFCCLGGYRDGCAALGPHACILPHTCPYPRNNTRTLMRTGRAARACLIPMPTGPCSLSLTTSTSLIHTPSLFLTHPGRGARVPDPAGHGRQAGHPGGRPLPAGPGHHV